MRSHSYSWITWMPAFALAILPVHASCQTPLSPDASLLKDTSVLEAVPQARARDSLQEVRTSVTQHSIRIQGKELAYTATAGTLPIPGPDGSPRAEMFFVAYTVPDQEVASRPVAFAFNGGPGASSIWLHLAALGPKRIDLGPEGLTLPESPRLLDNENTWLRYTDLVFVDPVGTGFSVPASGVPLQDFLGVESDIASVGDFIRSYTTRYDRWLSPKYLIGESYGTTRAAGLSGYLQDRGLNLSGIVLISSVLNLGTILFERGRDLAYVLFLPSYTAAAWYHRKLPSRLQSMDLEEATKEAEQWAASEYRLALAEGDALEEGAHRATVERLSEYTGLSPDFIRAHDMRVDNQTFADQLLADEGRTIGILDARVAGFAFSERSFTQDPSVFVLTGPLVATFNNYIRRDLRYRSEAHYEFLNMKVNTEWDWGQGTLDVTGTLSRAMSENTYLKVPAACGWYDLDTAWASQRYTMRHLGLPPEIRDNVRLVYFPAGHQLYTYLPALEGLTKEAAAYMWNR